MIFSIFVIQGYLRMNFSDLKLKSWFFCYAKFVLHWWRSIDKVILYSVFLLLFIGSLMSLSISPAIGARIGLEDGMYFFKKYIFFAFLGLFIVLFFSFLNIKNLQWIALFGFVCSFLLLFLVLFSGEIVKGSRRWLNLYFFTLQPSEIMKPFFIIVNGYIVSRDVGRYFYISLSSLLLLFGVLLLILEPDFGSVAVYLSLWFVQVFLGGVSRRFLSLIIPLPVVLAVIGFLFFPHFHNRIVGFVSKNIKFSSGINYQVSKSLDGIRNGGLFGMGLCEGVAKYQLPDSHTDYIVSVIVEEMGLVFLLFIIFLYFLITVKSLHRDYKDDKLRMIYVYSICFLLLTELFINICVAFNFLPSKGMVLPFISYGGSGMVANSILVGILLNLLRFNGNLKNNF
jgi:cell division protein FtsW